MVDLTHSKSRFDRRVDLTQLRVDFDRRVVSTKGSISFQGRFDLCESHSAMESQNEAHRGQCVDQKRPLYVFSLRACAFFKFYAEVINLIRSYDGRSTQLRVDLTEGSI